MVLWIGLAVILAASVLLMVAVCRIGTIADEQRAREFEEMRRRHDDAA